MSISRSRLGLAPALALALVATPACGGGADSASIDAGDQPTIDANDPPTIDAAPGDCVDDNDEDDDDVDTARVPDFTSVDVVNFAHAQICASDEDWYYVYLFGGETVEVAVTFTQTGAGQDLDVMLWSGECPIGDGPCTQGVPLTVCTDADQSGCDASNGQSRDADEQLSYTADVSGDRWFVVRGFQGAENGYDLCVAIPPGSCF